MKIAVINEVSAASKNPDIIKALEETGQEVLNLGNSGPDEEPSLLYTHTGFMAAAALTTGAADFVVGGCGTGQGFLTSAMQYPGVICGHILNSLDAWLFAQINGGNCISLALNQGYGWAGDVNLRFVFERLFSVEFGSGYPEHRKEPQKASRLMLNRIGEASHKPFADIISALPAEITETALLFPRMREALEGVRVSDEKLRSAIDDFYKNH